MEHTTRRPGLASIQSSRQMSSAVLLSRPEVGSCTEQISYAQDTGKAQGLRFSYSSIHVMLSVLTSSRSTLGLTTISRPMLTRRRCPPEMPPTCVPLAAQPSLLTPCSGPAAVGGMGDCILCLPV